MMMNILYISSVCVLCVCYQYHVIIAPTLDTTRKVTSSLVPLVYTHIQHVEQG